MRYEVDQRERTRERLLDEAAALIRAQGLERLTIGAVTKRVGMTHGGFYFHFSSREDLIAQAIVRMFERRYAAFLAQAGSVDPVAMLNRLVDYYLSVEHRDGLEDGCPIPILAGEQGRLPEVARARFALAVVRLTAGVAQLLERMGRQDGEARAASAVAEMVGAIALSRVHEDRAEAVRILEAAKQFVRGKLGLCLSRGENTHDHRLPDPTT